MAAALCSVCSCSLNRFLESSRLVLPSDPASPAGLLTTLTPRSCIEGYEILCARAVSAAGNPAGESNGHVASALGSLADSYCSNVAAGKLAAAAAPVLRQTATSLAASWKILRPCQLHHLACLHACAVKLATATWCCLPCLALLLGSCCCSSDRTAQCALCTAS